MSDNEKLEAGRDTPSPAENAAPQGCRRSGPPATLARSFITRNTLAGLTSVMRAAGPVEGQGGTGPSIACTPYGTTKSADGRELFAKSRIVILRPYIDAT